jgi:ComF family protein
VAAFAYAEPVSSLVAGFKYRAALQHGRVLGDLLLEQLRDIYSGQALPQLVIPVPLHPTRLRERGFNQALVLARHLGSGLGLPVAPEALRRVLHTPAQQGLSAKARKRNLRGAFRVELDLRPYTSIALVDDVVTTMSTMRELARVIRKAHPGEAELHVWCLARA